MKKLALIFLLGLSFKNGNTQSNYHKLLDKTDWYNMVVSFSWTSYWWMHSVNDTTINGMQYTEIYSDSTFAFYIREDTIARKVYKLKSDTATEYLLFDFSLTIGDSFNIQNGFTSTPSHLIGIDSVNTTNGYRKRFKLKLDGLTNQYWYTESVGDNFFGVQYGGDPVYYALCCFHSGEFLYSPSFSTDCTISPYHSPMTTILTPYQFNRLSIYPNPTKSIIQINIGDYNPNDKYIIKIIDSIGKVLYTKVTTQQINNMDLLNITTQGIYYVQIIDSEGKLRDNGKIILQ